jgi:uncharacterized protein (TIRG00374 family)
VIGATIALALVVVVLLLASPGRVWSLLRDADSTFLAAAFACAALTLGLRGLRLKLLLPAGQLRASDAYNVAAAAQSAALFVPARFGELALPWLLKRRAGWDAAAGIGTLLVARALDLGGLGLWAGLSLVGLFGWTRPLALLGAAVLVLPVLALPFAIHAVDRFATRWFAGRSERASRVAELIHELACSVHALGQRPLRFALAGACSIAMWASVWAMTWLLLVAMGHHWAITEVIAGSAAASVANILPTNLIGNLGTLEAGWTAAFGALGIPIEVAAATGLAAHLWALVFHAVYGAVAWLLLITRKNSKF